MQKYKYFPMRQNNGGKKLGKFGKMKNIYYLCKPKLVV